MTKQRINFDVEISQQDFANLIGLTRPAVTQMVSSGQLKLGGTVKEWVRQEIARARAKGGGGRPVGTGAELPPEDPNRPDLNTEKARLAREQRLTVEMKRQILLGEYASIALLTDALARASGAVVDQFDQMESTLAKSCPDLDENTKQAVLGLLAKARNAWIQQTMELVGAEVDAMVDEDEEEPL